MTVRSVGGHLKERYMKAGTKQLKFFVCAISTVLATLVGDVQAQSSEFRRPRQKCRVPSPDR